MFLQRAFIHKTFCSPYHFFLASASTVLSTCADYEFTCVSDGTCIPLSWRCDLADDCADKSDETSCSIGSSIQNKCDGDDFFHCKYSRKCIPKTWLCDNVHDCGLIGKFNLLDPSDEDKSQNCTKQCSPDSLQCSNGVCLPISKFCDGSVSPFLPYTLNFDQNLLKN